MKGKVGQAGITCLPGKCRGQRPVTIYRDLHRNAALMQQLCRIDQH